jgi:phosphoenolpyruvate-protein phosphotransferase
VVELAREMAGPDLAIEPAGGLDAPEPALGTDAMRVLAAIERADAGDGVLVLMDLGSAVLSAELALDLVAPERRERVLLCEAPLVEGAVAAAVAASGGLPLDRVAAEARGGLAAKAAHLGAEQPAAAADMPPTEGSERRIRIGNRLGLHARPAARFVRTATAFEADIAAVNETTGRGPARASSLNEVATLGARQGHELRLVASGPQAEQALEALVALAERNFDESDEEPAATAPSRAAVAVEGGLAGLPVSPGVAVAEVRRLERAEPEVAVERASDAGAELATLDQALDRAARDIRASRSSVAVRAGEEQAAIFDAHLLLLEDEALAGRARQAIAGESMTAAAAWRIALDEARTAWDAVDDDYLRARVDDLEAVGRDVLGHLVGSSTPPVLRAPGIVVAPDLTPAETVALDPGLVRGIATAFGGPTSHSAILARSLGIPAVAGVGAALLAVSDGTVLALDGDAGTIQLDPPPDVVAEYEARARTQAERERAARVGARPPARTVDGELVEVAANAGSAAEARAALDAGADGIGLLRTEFLFLDRSSMPDEDEQAAAYAEIARIMEGRTVILRTLDAGADKPLPYLDQPAEANPFLGVRGVRLGLERPELLETQLRAALRVAAEHPLEIMFPMVATLAEYRAARQAVERAREQLGLASATPIGLMVEVPAAALQADALAREADFFSLGTNDLTQYTLAAERGNERLAILADGLDPSVLRLVALVCDAGERRGRRVGVCGELASDPAAVPVLLGLGVRELSVAPPLVPRVKEAVRAVDLDAARDLARRALEQESAEAVRALVPSEIAA